MKIGRTLSLLTVAVVIAPPIPAEENFGAEFDALKAQYDARVKADVQQAYEVGVADLNVKYLPRWTARSIPQCGVAGSKMPLH
jgi:hypothetical protein